jgi:hypothetical protein
MRRLLPFLALLLIGCVPDEPQWLDANQTAEGDGVHVAILGVNECRLGAIMAIAIDNRNKDRLVHLRYEKYIYAKKEQTPPWDVVIRDDLGNHYRLEEQMFAQSIFLPLATALREDKPGLVNIVFNKPVAGAKLLLVTIPSPVDGGTHVFRFRAPLDNPPQDTAFFQITDANNYWVTRFAKQSLSRTYPDRK